MDVISPNASGPASVLNPNAPMFVPSAFKAVEDFSDEWWELVHSSPWFQDYWLRERFQDPQATPFFSPDDDRVLADLDALLNNKQEEEKEKKEYSKDLISLGSLKWRNMKMLAETPRFAEKAPKIVNRKVIPRPIQQPR